MSSAAASTTDPRRRARRPRRLPARSRRACRRRRRCQWAPRPPRRGDRTGDRPPRRPRGRDLAPRRRPRRRSGARHADRGRPRAPARPLPPSPLPPFPSRHRPSHPRGTHRRRARPRAGCAPPARHPATLELHASTVTRSLRSICCASSMAMREARRSRSPNMARPVSTITTWSRPRSAMRAGRRGRSAMLTNASSWPPGAVKPTALASDARSVAHTRRPDCRQAGTRCATWRGTTGTRGHRSRAWPGFRS